MYKSKYLEKIKAKPVVVKVDMAVPDSDRTGMSDAEWFRLMESRQRAEREIDNIVNGVDQAHLRQQKRIHQCNSILGSLRMF